MQRGGGGGCNTEEGPRQKPPVTDIVQNGCLKESRLAAGHWAKETTGSARGVDFAYYCIPTPRQENFIF